MKRKEPLPVPENETEEILTHLKKLDSTQKKKVIRMIKAMKATDSTNKKTIKEQATNERK